MDKLDLCRSFSGHTSTLLLPRMKVGIFGGSFNPAHEGHAHVASTARKRLGLDKIIWMVSPQNPMKPKKGMASFDTRFASALKQAIHPYDVVSDLEVRLKTVKTVDTVTHLKQRYPAVDFVWIMGADNLQYFHKWHGWRTIVQTLPIAVVARPESTLFALSSHFSQTYQNSRLLENQPHLLWKQTTPAWIFLNDRWNFQSSTKIRANQEKIS